MEYSFLRKRMVQEQLLRRGITDQRLLEVFGGLARESFVPEGLSASSYEDYPLPIGEGQTISQPYMVALMTQCLQLSGKEKVLEVGTGSGYQTAVLAHLAALVYSIERIPYLAQRARSRFVELGIRNVEVRIADGTLGWPEQGPFDRIIITAAAPRIPDPLIKQLKEGGLVVAPVGEASSQMLMAGKKSGGKLTFQNFGECVFVPLVGEYGFSHERGDK